MTERKGLFGLFGKKEDETKKEEARKKYVAGTSTKADIDKAKADMLKKQAELVKKAKEVKKHTVVSGDTLSSISQKYYKDIGKYMKIYEANKALIGDNPDLIKPGQELVIPKL
jgi:nucleoid-associated protein YgaU